MNLINLGGFIIDKTVSDSLGTMYHHFMSSSRESEGSVVIVCVVPTYTVSDLNSLETGVQSVSIEGKECTIISTCVQLIPTPSSLSSLSLSLSLSFHLYLFHFSPPSPFTSLYTSSIHP